MEKVTISTVTPVYRGALYLRDLVAAIDAERQAWEAAGLPVRLQEAIFVDDGSADGSAEVLLELANEYPWVHVISLSRNFGQHPATIAGLLHTSGDWVFTLDEDLQHKPDFFLGLLAHAMERNADLVYARPFEAVHGGPWRDRASRSYKTLIARLTGNPFTRLFNSFRLIRGSIARAAAAVAVHESYLDMLLCWFTDRVQALQMPMRDDRHLSSGQSGYSFGKLLSHARRLALSAQINYLRGGALLGMVGMSLAVVFGLYTLAVYLFSPGQIHAPGWTSLFIAILFFGGLSALLIGVLIEYFSTVLLQTQGKPNFFVVDRTQDAALQELLPRIRELAAQRQA